jgi:predicted PP-loop superfamily ATPase
MAECSVCLLHDRLPGVHVGANGLCGDCAQVCTETTAAREALQALINGEVERRGPYDAIVAFSGGKDSAGTLAYLSGHGLRLRAVLFDNGYIPDAVLRQSERVAASCGVDFEVVKADLTEAFREAFRNRSFSPAPCAICMRSVWKAMDAVAGRYGTQLICSGHRYPPGLKALAMRHLTRLLAVPVAAGLDSSALEQLRERINYTELGIPGQSSNCLIPQAVEAAFGEWFGFNPAIFELSKEVRCGLVSRAEALAALARKESLEPHAPTLIKLGLRDLV